MPRASIDNLPNVRIHRGVQLETLLVACRPSVIAVIFLGVLEKEWLGMWGHGMAEVHGWLEESRRHECGHVDVIVALIRFTAPMLHTKDSLEAKQGTREGEEENALKRGNDKFYRFVLRAR